MTDYTITVRQQGEPITLEVGSKHRVEVVRMHADLFELEASSYHSGSGVLLPDAADFSGSPPGERITPLAVLRSALQWAQENAPRRLLVVGHDGARATSQSMADSALFLLVGERDAWVSASQGRHRTRDVQQILKWVAVTREVGCDPGAVDDQWGSATEGALRAFQEHYNQAYGGSISVDGLLGPQSWGAMFDVMQTALAELLDSDVDGLNAIREEAALELVKVDESDRAGAVGVGSEYPVPEARQSLYRSPDQRRVEVLFFEPGHEPLAHCLCELYEIDRYVFEPHEIPPITTPDPVPPKKKKHVLELGHVNFHFDSAVLLPEGLDVLRAGFAWVEANPGKRMLVAGHTDTVGSDEYNERLARARSASVFYVFLGDRDAWYAAVQDYMKVEDYQRILQWYAVTYGADTDPGAVDNKRGPATRKALKAFQQDYNQRFGGSLGVDGIIGRNSWRAMFDVYRDHLATLLGTDAAGLTALGASLPLLETSDVDAPGRRGFGERYPLPGMPGNADENRRVEFVFFDPGEEPSTLEEIYDGETYETQPIPQ